MHAYHLCASSMTEVTLAGNSEMHLMHSDPGFGGFFFVFIWDGFASFKKFQTHAQHKTQEVCKASIWNIVFAG